MTAKFCDVIQDLLPLYVDSVCSEESRRIVSEHLEHCAVCRQQYDGMSSEAEQKREEPELDTRRAFETVSHKWKKRKAAAVLITALLTVLLTVTGMTVYENVGVVHDFFSPVTTVILREVQTGEEWYAIPFPDGDTLRFDSLFYQKEVILDGDSHGPVRIRFRDSSGAVVLEERTLHPGELLDLEELRRNREYTVEIKAEAAFLLLRFC